MACCKLAKVDPGKVAKGDCCEVAKGDCCEVDKGDSRDMAKGDCRNLVTGKASGFWDIKTNCCPGKDVVRKVGGVPGVRGKQFANPAGTASGWPKVGPGVPGVRGKQFAGTASGWPKVGPGVRGEAGRTGLKENRPGVAGAADDTRLALVVASCERGCQPRGQKITKRELDNKRFALFSVLWIRIQAILSESGYESGSRVLMNKN
jgi:hypothetical protein